MPHTKSTNTSISKNNTPNRKGRRKNLQARAAAADTVIVKTPQALVVKRIVTSLLFWLFIAIAVGGYLCVAYPRVWVYPGKPAVTGQPFQVPFILKNSGYCALRDIHYSVSMEDIDFGKGNTLSHAYSNINETHIPALDPGKSATISLEAFIGLLKQSFGIILPPNAVTTAEISVDLSYRSYLIPYTFRNRVHFKAEKGNAGEYAWSEYHRKK